jgi:signal transduction histidine kinase
MLTRHVTITTDLMPSLPIIHADRVQMQQILLNLTLNAADAMSGNATGNRTVTIRTELAGAEIRLSVSDRGPGIAAEHLKNVFDAFWSTKAGGIGIGLAICRTIVAAHGGSITAANNADGGATFCVTLPAQEAA